MKTIILNITLLLLTVSTFGQTKLLKDYDFEKGGYYILGEILINEDNTLQDSIGDFYTDDVSVLNKFKKDWVFKKQGKKYACGYHYTIYVCKQGQILESFSINLECKEIVTNKGYFYFDPNLLRQFYGKFKKPYARIDSFKTITEAREYRTKILNDTTLIMTEKPLWTEYEGSFRFTYKCAENTKNCLDNEEKILKLVESEIKEKYPSEKFLLLDAGGSLTTVFIEIICNKSLSDNFDLYYRDEQKGLDKWSPFNLKLITFWTVEK